MSEDFSTQMQDRLWEEIDTLRAELERVRGERDARQDALDSTMSVFFGENVPKHYEPGHVSVHVMALVATIEQLRYERDAAEAERDAARAAAAALRKWGVTWRVIAWDSERFQQFRTFDNIQQMWATVRPDVEYGDSHND